MISKWRKTMELILTNKDRTLRNQSVGILTTSLCIIFLAYNKLVDLTLRIFHSWIKGDLIKGSTKILPSFFCGSLSPKFLTMRLSPISWSMGTLNALRVNLTLLREVSLRVKSSLSPIFLSIFFPNPKNWSSSRRPNSLIDSRKPCNNGNHIILSYRLAWEPGPSEMLEKKKKTPTNSQEIQGPAERWTENTDLHNIFYLLSSTRWIYCQGILNPHFELCGSWVFQAQRKFENLGFSEALNKAHCYELPYKFPDWCSAIPIWTTCAISYIKCRYKS